MALLDNTNITEEEIAQQGLTALDDKYQKSIGYFAWDYFVAVGKILYKVWQKIIYIVKCLTDLSNMDYDDLVNFVFQTRGIEAKKETYASGYLTVVTGQGTINMGDTFKTSSDVEYEAIETKDVVQGDTFKVQCLTAGTIGNVGQNTITIIPTTIRGIVAVTNAKAFTNGYEKESKEDLLERYYDDIRKPVTSGNIYHYKKWALEVTGVGDAKIKPLWDGDNTVKVVIINSNKEVPSLDLINAVQNHIDPDSEGLGLGEAPIGAYCTVVGAVNKLINVSISGLQIKAGYLLQDVKTNIQNSIKEYLSDLITEIFDNNDTSISIYVSYARVSACIMDSDGVVDYTSYTLNSTSTNVTLVDSNSATEIPVLNTLTITE